MGRARLHLSLAITFLALWTLGSLALAKAVGIHEPPPPAFCLNDAERNRVRTITLDAIDDAMKLYVVHLFNNWVKDEYNQPHRALVGFYNAASAYERARDGVLNWNPPNCK